MQRHTNVGIFLDLLFVGEILGALAFNAAYKALAVYLAGRPDPFLDELVAVLLVNERSQCRKDVLDVVNEFLAFFAERRDI